MHKLTIRIEDDNLKTEVDRLINPKQIENL